MGDTSECADYVVSAVPFDVLLKLLPQDVVDTVPCFSLLRRLEHSPILAVHLWFDRNITDLDYAALPGRTVQWMFNKTRNFAEADVGANYLGLVISAARGLIEKSRKDIIEITLREVREAFPSAREANLTRSVVIKEPKATFSIVPESEQFRADQKSPIANLFIAGDWTKTGWPATMEGAVRSGYRCAEHILEAEGKSKTILQPDLRPGLLVRCLQGRKGMSLCNLCKSHYS